ncbi:retrovirus-related Pol polyprotein from transposon 17.6 [Trichonephila clavipes]|nr:retrovirus-related Pol polyprotein from transposon 17.6 [Trichonephila clavipes]
MISSFQRKNEQEGLEKLKIIFEVAKKYGLEIKFKKCQFLKKKIEFLGHIVESGTIKPSPTKTLRCTLNLSRAETSSRWCGVVVRRGGASSGVVHVT